MTEIVVDSSVVLAWIKGERGGEQVSEMLERGVISSVTVTEVVSSLIDAGYSLESARLAGEQLPFRLSSHHQALALRAGMLRAETRHLGLSLGDRACLALAKWEKLPVLTADRIWADLDIGIEVRLIR